MLESNPGLLHTRQQNCFILYSNIRVLQAYIDDLAVSSKHSEILFCFEILVSEMRYISELLVPSYKKPVLFSRVAILRAHVMALYIKNEFSASHEACYKCGCHEMQVVKV